MNRQLITWAAAGFSLTLAGPALGQVVLDIRLGNHPDADAAPPGYGLRLDDLFLQDATSGSLMGGTGGTTTFSFDAADGADMRLTVEDLGSSLVISISGLAYGGVDTGAGYGFGEGLYQIDFTYSVGVMEMPGPDGGYVVDPGSTTNQGTITSLGNADVAAGTEWTMYQQLEGSLKKFALLRDGHRLSGFPDWLAMDPYVGRAWVTYNEDGSDTAGYQDWLFTGEIPAPATLAPLAAAGLVTRRRRR